MDKVEITDEELIIDEAMDYLLCGGLGEVWGLATVASRQGAHKVQLDTDLAIALCQLAQQGIANRVLQ